MEEKKRRADDPLEDEPDEKKRRVDWRYDNALEREYWRVKNALLDPNTWLPHIVGEFQPTARYLVPPLEIILAEIAQCLRDILTEEDEPEYSAWRLLTLSSRHLGSLPPIIFECRLFETIFLDRDAPVTIIPAEIGQWKGRNLSFTETGILRLPHEIGDCEELHMIDLLNSKIQELPRRLGKCPELWSVFLGREMTCDPERPRLWQFKGLDGVDIAAKLKRDWASYVTSMSCLLFCLETRICKETPEGISGDIPRDILPHIASFL
jgi:hypothetical protein